MIQCLIIEDELPAQRILEEYINDTPNLVLVSACSNALKALEILKNRNIDLIFLDIHLPKLSGISFLKSLETKPNVILTTAYQNYAIESYELNVIDYLLKPFSFERFLKAVDKVNVKSKQELSIENNFIFIKSGKKTIRTKIKDLVYIEGQSEYVKIFYEDKSVVVFQSLNYYESILPETTFIRVHRSYIINISRIESIEDNKILINNRQIPIGRVYREKLNTIITDFQIENRN